MTDMQAWLDQGRALAERAITDAIGGGALDPPM